MTQNGDPAGGQLVGLMFLFPFALLTGIGTWGMIGNSWMSLTSHWEPVTARIVSQKTFEGSRIRTWYQVEYDVSGARQTGFCLKELTEEGAAPSHQTGDSLQVYYDVAHPEDVSLTPYEVASPIVTILFTLVMIVFFVICGGSFVLLAMSLWGDITGSEPLQENKLPSFFQLVLIAVFLALISFVITPKMQAYLDNRSTTDWIRATGRMQSNQIEQEAKYNSSQQTSAPHFYYRLIVDYDYELNGQRFHGDQLTVSDWHLSYKLAHRFSQDLAAGNEVPVLVNPADNSEAVLMTGGQTYVLQALYPLFGAGYILFCLVTLCWRGTILQVIRSCVTRSGRDVSKAGL